MTVSRTIGMAVKIGVSLRDGTHARAAEAAKRLGSSPSGFIDAAIPAQFTE